MSTLMSALLFSKINILNQIELEGILNLKETRYFSLINKTNEIPKDIFNIICDNIIQEISKKEKLSFTDFRDTLYDILTYNLDVTECLWYILRYFIENNYLNSQDITHILDKSYYFLNLTFLRISVLKLPLTLLNIIFLNVLLYMLYNRFSFFFEYIRFNF